MDILDKNSFDHVVGGAGPAGAAVGCAAGAGAGAATGAGNGAGAGTSGGASGAAVGGVAGGVAGAVAGCAAGAAVGAVGGVGAASGAGAAVGGVAGTVAGCAATSCGGGGGGGKVICTELCRNGVIEHDVWMADIRYSRENFSEQTMRGYHAWGVPYVRLMRKYPAFAKIASAPTRWFAEDIAYRMGVRNKPSPAGWALRELGFRPLCWTLGLFVKASDWQSLWRTNALPVKSA